MRTFDADKMADALMKLSHRKLNELQEARKDKNYPLSSGDRELIIIDILASLGLAFRESVS